VSYLFDASSIFEAIARNRVEVLEGYTLDLARYELLNVVWKKLSKDGVEEEYPRLVKIIKRVLGLLRVITIDCSELDILKIARHLGITVYDASYVFYARKLDVALVTEDQRLRRAADGHIKIYGLEEVPASRIDMPPRVSL
jgi:predicted nucleic acid-binding protein